MPDILSLGDAIDLYLRKHRLRDQADVQRAIAAWPEVVGTGIAQHTGRISYAHGVLSIAVEAPVWRHELTHKRLDMMQRVNQFVGRNVVREIRIV